MPGQITAIKMQKKNNKRVNIFVDGEFVLGLPLLEGARLRKGQYLSDEDIAALRLADECARAYELALNFLSYRPRSTAEVNRRLEKKEFGSETIAFVIEKLCQARLLDDEAFARYWIENRGQFKPRGARALRYELWQKGVPDQIIDFLVEDLNETENAYRAVISKLNGWRRLDLTTFKRRMTGFLQRRGFNYDVIRETWDRLQVEGKTPSPEREDTEAWD